MTALVPDMNIMHKNTETGRQKRALDACARSWALCLLRLKRAFKNTALQCFIMNDFGSLSSPSRHAFRRRRRNGCFIISFIFINPIVFAKGGCDHKAGFVSADFVGLCRIDDRLPVLL